MAVLRWDWLGRQSYARAHLLQKEVHAAVVCGNAPATLLLLEHDPLITVGRRGGVGDVLALPETLSALGIPVVAAERGGQATYHGPGQLVGYLIARARALAPDLPALVSGMEEAMMATCTRLGVPARRDPGHRGLWAGPAKLGFVGLAVSHGVTWHGLALNIAPDLSAFELIRPCGLDDPITSIAAAGGAALPLRAIAELLSAEVARSFALEPRRGWRGANSEGRSAPQKCAARAFR